MFKSKRLGLEMSIVSMVTIFTLILAPQLYAQVASSENKVDSSYVLQVGDKINVKIYPEDEFIKGGEAEVSSEGMVTLPLIGKIVVEDKSVLAVEKEIAEIVDRDFIANPQVVIEVLLYQTSSYVVLGQVNKPGTYDLPVAGRKMTLLHAISVAGGFTEIANFKRIKVMRKSTGERLDVNAESIIGGSASDVEIRADDVIHVSESLF